MTRKVCSSRTRRAVSDRVAHKPLTTAQLTILGSAVTSLVSVEGAALCNPSAVAHPSQSGLRDGELRVAVAVRGIGEGHVSSIGFAEAVIGADRTWTFGVRSRPLSRAAISGGEWSRQHLGEALDDAGQLRDLASAVLLALPERFHAARPRSRHRDPAIGSRDAPEQPRSAAGAAGDVRIGVSGDLLARRAAQRASSHAGAAGRGPRCGGRAVHALDRHR